MSEGVQLSSESWGIYQKFERFQGKNHLENVNFVFGQWLYLPCISIVCFDGDFWQIVQCYYTAIAVERSHAVWRIIWIGVCELCDFCCWTCWTWGWCGMSWIMMCGIRDIILMELGDVEFSSPVLSVRSCCCWHCPWPDDDDDLVLTMY